MISSFYQHYSKWILWGVVLTFPFVWHQSESIRSNNDIETWLPRDTEVRQNYEDFKADFGGEEVIVIGVPDAVMGEKVGAVIVPRPGQQMDTADLLAFARQHLADFKIPQYVLVRAEPLPRNPGGKILKAALRNSVEWGKPLR